MSTATGNPVFQTIGGDASLATVAYTPAATTQTPNPAAVTMTLAQVSASVASAVALSTAANATASAAQTAVQNALNGYIPESARNAPNGVFMLDQNAAPVAYQPAGSGDQYLSLASGTSGYFVHLQFASVNAAGPTTTIFDSGFIAWGGTSGQGGTGNLSFVGYSFMPNNDVGADLGSGSNRWNNVYAQNGAIQTSDLTEKTLIGSFDDATFAEGTKLVSLFDNVSAKMFTYNNGSSTREHVGYIAQEVEAAITKAGLDPAKYGLWCQDALTKVETTTDSTGKKRTAVVNVTNPDGSQAYRQALRYDQLAVLMTAGAKLKIADLETRLAVLESKANGTTAS